MNKCLKLTITLKDIADYASKNQIESYMLDINTILYEIIQNNAKNMSLEGYAQYSKLESLIKIIICGEKNIVDDFIEIIHKGIDKKKIKNIISVEIEPFAKEKDYRNIFRIIE